ncbi:unnamed protein product [Ectocarpus sp. CCAP 1310/34]|nr:unnamed protein product [Ectocarpus sp. CCAP 1310/34]
MATAAVARPWSPHSVAKHHRPASNVEDRKKSHARLSQDTDEWLRKLRAGLANHTKNTDKRDRHRRLQTCAEGSGVTVTSSLFSLLEGCLAEMDVKIGEEVELVGDSEMIASELDSDSDDAEYIWVACYDTTSLDIACISLESVTSVHPSTATWYSDACFKATGGLLSDETVNTLSGGLDGGEMWVFGLPISDDVGAAVRW